MTDQEVNELMQRFLDDDLTEDESEALTEHLRQSPDSAYVFERLKRLDSELEQLPKVIPPMSIVDSILPRLELPRLADDPSDTGTSSNDSQNRAVPMGRKAAIRERVNYRMLGGVVAAGIVLTLFFTNLAPQMMPSFHKANDNSAANSASMKSAISLESEDKSLQRAADPQTESADAGQSMITNEATEVEADSSFSVTNTSEPESFDPSSPESNDSAPAIGNDADEVSTTDESDEGQSPDMKEVDPEVVAAEKADANTMMEIQEEPLITIVSPNKLLLGNVMVGAEGGQQITITEPTGKQIFQSSVYEGLLTRLQWSPDSLQLHFEAHMSNEVTEHITIDIINLEEIKK
jgi:cytoskeletal protein RodZ